MERSGTLSADARAVWGFKQCIFPIGMGRCLAAVQTSVRMSWLDRTRDVMVGGEQAVRFLTAQIETAEPHEIKNRLGP